jgi:hypothetical protein
VTIQTGKYRIHIGWRLVLRWPGIIRAAASHYTHGTVYIGPFRVASVTDNLTHAGRRIAA